MCIMYCIGDWCLNPNVEVILSPKMQLQKFQGAELQRLAAGSRLYHTFFNDFLPFSTRFLEKMGCGGG